MELKEGKQYRLKQDSDGGRGWFKQGGIITLGNPSFGGTYHAKGPAACYNVDGRHCAEGDILSGYVDEDSLEEEVQPKATQPEANAPVDLSFTIGVNHVEIRIEKHLTVDQVYAMLKAVNL